MSKSRKRGIEAAPKCVRKDTPTQFPYNDALNGDVFYTFTCSVCNYALPLEEQPENLNNWKRIPMTWFHVVHLAFYDLHTRNPDKEDVLGADPKYKGVVIQDGRRFFRIQELVDVVERNWDYLKPTEIRE
ncbi:hypothetical protein M427DRAFT_27167 [Gonapodya prolifera JEL478]|uniref:Uncharacterized protein n=1 Tax=Gonapodya prolifera (strain JEL478) TaxID=1344416 RepID=A0A139AXU2_GONPJ|nr:hypothetical protein M427DRAFT_27167 [Gonapodya prolifera JEL478]|eukprot:KXS21524.1 hypothetical protein M427DRAFT_27167 [Gonapodya prolifera JEL478]